MNLLNEIKKYPDSNYIAITIALISKMPGLTDLYLEDGYTEVKYYYLHFSNSTELLAVQNKSKVIFLEPINCTVRELKKYVTINSDGVVFGNPTKFRCVFPKPKEVVQ